LARSRKKRKGRGLGFIFLAGLTLLIAGFIARHEIPILIKEAGQPSARPAQADIGSDVRGATSGYRPPSRVYAGAASASGKRLESRSRDSDQEIGKKGPHDNITDSERRQLNKLIQEKSR
jgi:hypothetical protein